MSEIDCEETRVVVAKSDRRSVYCIVLCLTCRCFRSDYEEEQGGKDKESDAGVIIC